MYHTLISFHNQSSHVLWKVDQRLVYFMFSAILVTHNVLQDGDVSMVSQLVDGTELGPGGGEVILEELLANSEVPSPSPSSTPSPLPIPQQQCGTSRSVSTPSSSENKRKRRCIAQDSVDESLVAMTSYFAGKKKNTASDFVESMASVVRSSAQTMSFRNQMKLFDIISRAIVEISNESSETSNE